MSIDVKYTTRATSTGGRDGETRSEDGRFTVRLSTPKELGGAGGEGTNPEQLFAAGYSACFIGALKVAGQQLKLKVPAETSVTATVGSARARPAGSASPPISRSACPASTAPMPRGWSRRPIRSALTRTPPATMSKSG